MLPSEAEAAAFVTELQQRKAGGGAAAGQGQAHAAAEREAARPGDAGAPQGGGRTVHAYQALLNMSGLRPP